MRTSLLIAVFAAAVSHAVADNWPSFRGPEAKGVADGQNLPAAWDVKTGVNVRWKSAVPGAAHSSPVLWGDRVFLTTVVTQEAPDFVMGDKGGIQVADERVTHSWRVLALAAGDGRLLWEKEVRAGLPRSKRHVKASHSNATPATDGQNVVAILGSEGLFAFDTDGRQKWNADLGVLNPGLFGDAGSEWGHASSPILVEKLAIVQVDRHKDSFLAAFDLETGKRVWTIPRDERPVWATPTLVQAGARSELVVVGGNYTRAYEPRTGREL